MGFAAPRKKFVRVHAVCAMLRKKPCDGCPAWESTPYGRAKRGCRLEAEEAVNIAVQGNPWGSKATRKGVTRWRDRHQSLYEDEK